MPNFRVRCDVDNVNGYQSWIVEASSKEEAILKYEKGEGEFEAEELEVTSLDPPDISAVEEVE